MTREEFEYAIKSCGCFIYRGQTYYEESELIKTFEDLGLIHIGLEQELSDDLITSVNPQPKTGHWIKTISENGITSAVRCSECGFEDNRYMLFRYCPDCGRRMVEPQESEKINCKTTKCENCTNHNYCDYEPQESEDKGSIPWTTIHEAQSVQNKM